MFSNKFKVLLQSEEGFIDSLTFVMNAQGSQLESGTAMLSPEDSQALAAVFDRVAKRPIGWVAVDPGYTWAEALERELLECNLGHLLGDRMIAFIQAA